MFTRERIIVVKYTIIHFFCVALFTKTMFGLNDFFQSYVYRYPKLIFLHGGVIVSITVVTYVLIGKIKPRN